MAKNCPNNSQLIQWKMWYCDGAKTKFNSLGPSGKLVIVVQLSYQILRGEGNF